MPPHLAYGDYGTGDIIPGTQLMCESYKNKFLILT